MTKRIMFNQFFTPSTINSLLVNESRISPSTIMDFTMGEGSLLIAAQNKWPFASLMGNDIDSECIAKAKTNIHNITTYNQDFTSSEFLLSSSKNHSNIDLCLGNPPFKMTPNTKAIQELLKSFSLNVYLPLKNIPTEMLFVLLCIQSVKDGGEIITILPDGIFVNEKWGAFRSFLVNNYYIHNIMELPAKSFSFTEAKTHILAFKKSFPKDKVRITSIDKEEIFISKKESEKRLDYSYYSENKKMKYFQKKSHNIEIIRGKTINKHLFVHKNFLHTTDFKKHFQILNARNRTTRLFNKIDCKIAQPGDIIIPRVGTRCLGKVAYIKNGYFAISDCLIILRTDCDKLQASILKTLNSEYGKNWIKSISKGVAARHITMSDLKNLPLLT